MLVFAVFQRGNNHLFIGFVQISRPHLHPQPRQPQAAFVACLPPALHRGRGAVGLARAHGGFVLGALFGRLAVVFGQNQRAVALHAAFVGGLAARIILPRAPPFTV